MRKRMRSGESREITALVSVGRRANPKENVAALRKSRFEKGKKRGFYGLWRNCNTRKKPHKKNQKLSPNMEKSWPRNVLSDSFDHVCRGGGGAGSRKSRFVGISPTFCLQVVAAVVAELPRTQRLSSSLRSYSKTGTMTLSFFLHPVAFIINKDI